MTATCWPAATAVPRGSLDGWSTDNRLRADFNTGDLAHTLILGAEYHRFRNDLWTERRRRGALNPFSGYTAQTRTYRYLQRRQ